MKLGWAVLLLASVTACADEKPTDCGGTCPAGWTCVDGACRCEDDGACGPDAFCNAMGSCQARPGCRRNQDCADGERCDVLTGRCLSVANCARDTHCPIGAYCEAGQCRPGCREDGDCPPGALCDAGACMEGLCRVNEDCDFGDRCVRQQCFTSANPSHCAPCGDRDCPFADDFCLVNPAFDPDRNDPRDAFFCGVPCTGEPEICPAGYTCETVVRLTEDRCRRGQSCGLNRDCVIEENAEAGFCTCATTADCPNDEASANCRLGFCDWPRGRLCSDADECEPLPLCGRHGAPGADVCFFGGAPCEQGRDCLCVEGTCVNSSRPCATAADCFIRCDDGACRVGDACKPRDDLSCDVLR